MKYFYIVAFILIQLSAVAQDFEHAIGFKAGITSGISYKTFFDAEKSFEAIATFRGGGTQLAFLKQYHNPVLLEFTQQLFFYYGFGSHVGYRVWGNADVDKNGERIRYREFSVGLGLVGNIGFEYHVLKYPIIFCVDYKPYAEVNAPYYFRKNFHDLSFSIMYTFSK